MSWPRRCSRRTGRRRRRSPHSCLWTALRAGWNKPCAMKSFLLFVALAMAIAGCASESSDSASSEAPERDGFQGQMGVMAGDPSDYGN